MALGTIATIATIAAAATSVAGAAYGATQSVKYPDAGSSSRKVANAQAQSLPSQLKLQQLEQQGGKGTVWMPAHQEQKPFVKIETGWEVDKGKSIRNQFLGGFAQRKKTYENVPYVASEWQPGGKYYGKGTPEVIWKTVDIPAGDKEFDFTGHGTADIQADAARRQADLELELGRKYGTQFAETARKLQEQADPLGTQARAMEAQLLDRDMPMSSLPGTLNEQILGQVQAGRGYDAMTRDLLDQSVAAANAARAGHTSAADVATSGSTGMEGQARLNAATQKAGQFLASGATPEDQDYKRRQQDIANMASFVNGQTPESQFGNIAHANQGATPVSGAQPNATMPNNAASLGGNYSSSAYSSAVNQALTQPNWMTGLSSLLTGIGALKNMGG